jgi:membrane fusion protein, multidrug efflux system
MTKIRPRPLVTVATLLATCLAWGTVSVRADPATPASAAATIITVRAIRGDSHSVYEGSVEALRSTQISAQVTGAVVDLSVKAGDRVRAGQTLARIDSRAAEQGAQASSAQVAAARAQVDLAQADLARKRQLQDQSFISKAAVEQAESQQRAALAQWRTTLAQNRAALTQASFHRIQAPYDGVVAALQVTQGDMAMPGRALLTVYDPKALRVAAGVPASDLAGMNLAAAKVSVDIPALGGRLITPSKVDVLTSVDPQTLTQTVRADLPQSLEVGLVPGQFARLQFSADTTSRNADTLAVPTSAVIRRSELTAVYVLDTKDRPVLRQVRLGQPLGTTEVEVLAGLDAGERVLTQPATALKP